MISRARNDKPVAILGGGIAGLTAATFLKRHQIPFILFEGSAAVAGLMKTDRDSDGFTYDCGVHFVTNRLAAAVGFATQCKPMSRYGESVFLNGRHYSYPLGLMSNPKFVGSAVISRAKGVFGSSVKSAAEHFQAKYGYRLANEIACPLTAAWSGYDASEIAASVDQKFATSLPRMMLLRSAAWMTGRVIGIGYAGTITESSNSWHVYPNGGMASICQVLADEVREEVRLNCKVESVQVKNNRVSSIVANGEEFEVAGVISTAPVHALAKMVQGTDALKPLQAFRYRAMVFVNLKIDGSSGLKEVVTWVPEDRFPFFRLSDIGMGLPFLVPAGKSHVTCDIGCQIGDEVWNASDEDLAQQCIAGLEEIAPGLGKRVIGSRVVRVPLAYPIYHLDYEQHRKQFENGSGIHGLLSVGRNGEFAHILMEDVYWRTRWKLAKFLKELNA